MAKPLLNRGSLHQNPRSNDNFSTTVRNRFIVHIIKRELNGNFKKKTHTHAHTHNHVYKYVHIYMIPQSCQKSPLLYCNSRTVFLRLRHMNIDTLLIFIRIFWTCTGADSEKEENMIYSAGVCYFFFHLDQKAYLRWRIYATASFRVFLAKGRKQQRRMPLEKEWRESLVLKNSQ